MFRETDYLTICLIQYLQFRISANYNILVATSFWCFDLKNSVARVKSEKILVRREAPTLRSTKACIHETKNAK